MNRPNLRPVLLFLQLEFFKLPEVAFAHDRGCANVADIHGKLLPGVRGNSWFFKGEFERAASDFDLALGTDPNLAVGYYNRAVTRFRLEDFDRSLADFNRAILLEPATRGSLYRSLRPAVSDGRRGWRDQRRQQSHRTQSGFRHSLGHRGLARGLKGDHRARLPI